MYNKRNYVLLVIFSLILIGAGVNSASWFRLKLAQYYKDNRQYIKAIQTYNKILRKNSVREHLGDITFAQVNFNLGHLYAKLNLVNLAIESYAKGSSKFAAIESPGYYDGNDLEKDKLLAVGLLEAGRLERAIEEFRNLKRLYPQFTDSDKYIDVAVSLGKQNAILKNNSLFLKIGDTYIENSLINEGREFFTKRILSYGLSPLEVLNYVSKVYSRNDEIKQRIWGDRIYVTLEDFECIKPRLRRWTSNLRPKVTKHYISADAAYKGNYSEFLHLLYQGKGYDYWIRAVDIPLDNLAFPLCLRVFIKGKKPFKGYLKTSIIYPQQKTSGIEGGSDIGKIISDGWQVLSIDNVSEKAERIAAVAGWNTTGMKIDRVIIDPAGVTNQFYIDEIELCIGGL